MLSENDPILPLTTTEPPARTRWHRVPLLAVHVVVAFWSLVYHEVLGLMNLVSWMIEGTTRKDSLPIGIPDEVQRRWGQYSPYYPAGKYVPPPQGCHVTQVNIVRGISS